MGEEKLTLAKKRSREGLCPRCGKWAYPYYLCHEHRTWANMNRVLNDFEKKGYVIVKGGPKFRDKQYKWNHNIHLNERLVKNFSPETVAKMQLPRMNGKPLTDKVFQDCLLKVLEANGVPMTEKEIEKGFKSMKTIGEIIQDNDALIREYKLIRVKQSNLSRKMRDAVMTKVNFLIERNAISSNQLT